MARMNLSTRRDAPGMSVFWMILIVGAGVFLLLAIVLMTSGGESQLAEHDETEIISGEGDDVPGTSSFAGGEVAEEGPGSEEVPDEAGELDEAVPETGLADDDEASGTVGAVDVDPAEEVEAPQPDPEAEAAPADLLEEGAEDATED